MIFPLGVKTKISTMSKGMQRQAALICAFSARPDYLFMDEIFDGLDPVMRQLLKRLISDDVADRGMTVVIASHNLRELEDLCDHVGLFHKGGVIFEKDLDELRLGVCKVQAVFKPMPEKEALRAAGYCQVGDARFACQSCGARRPGRRPCKAEFHERGVCGSASADAGGSLYQ